MFLSSFTLHRFISVANLCNFAFIVCASVLYSGEIESYPLTTVFAVLWPVQIQFLMKWPTSCWFVWELWCRDIQSVL